MIKTIRDHRKHILKKTQEQIARAARGSQTVVSNIEKGKLPNGIGVLPRYLRAYKLSEKKFMRLVAAVRGDVGHESSENAGGALHDAQAVSGRESVCASNGNRAAS